MNLNKEISASNLGHLKSIAKGTFLETVIESGFFVLTFQNDSQASKLLGKAIDSSFIQFHFCLKGNAQFCFNNNSYTLDIPEETPLLLYNPQRDLPIHMVAGPKTWVLSVLISVVELPLLIFPLVKYFFFFF